MRINVRFYISEKYEKYWLFIKVKFDKIMGVF